MKYPKKYVQGLVRYKLYNFIGKIDDELVRSSEYYIDIDPTNHRIDGEKIEFGNSKQVEILREIKQQKAKGYNLKIPRVYYLEEGMIFRGFFWWGNAHKTILKIDKEKDVIKLRYAFPKGCNEKTVKIQTFVKWTLRPSTCMLRGDKEFYEFKNE